MTEALDLRVPGMGAQGETGHGGQQERALWCSREGVGQKHMPPLDTV